MLKISNLYFDYPDKSILQNVSFTLPAGKLLHLHGKNGAGKTTLLKILAGLFSPDRGEIQFQNQSIFDDLSAYQRHICYLGHKTGISSLLTIQENYQYSWLPTPSKQYWEECLNRLELHNLDHVPCGLLSAGQKRRVGLLRLMISKASVWLLDEPLVALDAQGVNILMSILTEHLVNHGQIILTSHQSLPLENIPYQEYHL